MSHHDYIMSQRVGALDIPFYALIMAAIRQADSENLDKLRQAFPEVFLEYWGRYHAAGGLLNPAEAVNVLGIEEVSRVEAARADSDG
jgi:hypothetical protein